MQASDYEYLNLEETLDLEINNHDQNQQKPQQGSSFSSNLMYALAGATLGILATLAYYQYMKRFSFSSDFNLELSDHQVSASSAPAPPAHQNHSLVQLLEESTEQEFPHEQSEMWEEEKQQATLQQLQLNRQSVSAASVPHSRRADHHIHLSKNIARKKYVEDTAN